MNSAFEATAIPGFSSPVGDPAAPSRMPVWLRGFFDPASFAPPDAIDRSTRLYNRAGLFATANQIIRARRSAVPASVIVLEFADLRELCDIYGTPIARKVVDKLVRRLRKLAGRHGLAGRTGHSQFTVVLPGVAHAKALQRLYGSLGNPARIEFDAGESEIVLVPDFFVDTLDAGTEQVQGLYREMCSELARLKKSERRRLHRITAERQRHSRPMTFSAQS